MHLVPRENLPEPSNGDQKRKHKQDHHPETMADTSPQAISTTTSPANATTTGCCDACCIS